MGPFGKAPASTKTASVMASVVELISFLDRLAKQLRLLVSNDEMSIIPLFSFFLFSFSIFFSYLTLSVHRSPSRNRTRRGPPPPPLKDPNMARGGK